MNLYDEFWGVVTSLNEAQIPYAVCGGLAVAIHGFPRATRDIDIMILEEQLERVLSSVEKLDFTLPAGIIKFNVGKEDESRVYRISKAQGEDLLTLDLILDSPFLKSVWDSRETIEVDNKPVHVVSLKGLIKMKKAAGRPQDIADLENLNRDE